MYRYPDWEGISRKTGWTEGYIQLLSLGINNTSFSSLTKMPIKRFFKINRVTHKRWDFFLKYKKAYFKFFFGFFVSKQHLKTGIAKYKTLYPFRPDSHSRYLHLLSNSPISDHDDLFAGLMPPTAVHFNLCILWCK